MNTEYQFMVNFTMQKNVFREFKEMIPYQKLALQRLFEEGKLRSYAQSSEATKSWAIVNANSEMEVMKILADLPITIYTKVEISMLSLYNTVENHLPAFSKN